MKSYTVTIQRTAYCTIEVEANSVEEAEELAWKQYEGEADDCAENIIYDIELTNKQPNRP
jgi:hypothetical protein